MIPGLVRSVLLLALCAAPQVNSLRQTPNECSADVLAEMSPRMRRLAESQPVIDAGHDDYTPMLTDDHFEVIPTLGQVVLGSRLAQNKYSTVFNLTSHPGLLIKYQTDCQQLGAAVHPLLSDFWPSREAAKINASAKPVFISPAASLLGATGRKTSFTMAHHALRDCEASGGVVRFMVMEHLDACLDRHPLVPNMERAILSGVQIIALLERLHNAGIFHGDIHSGNICLSRTTPGQLRLIDFGLGGFTDGESDELSSSPWLPHESVTEWQLRGFPSARRDDIYRTIEMVASFAVGPSMWTKAHSWAWGNVNKLLEWKQHGSPFVTPVANAAHLIPGLPPHMRADVSASLDAAVAKARALVSVSTPIPYDSIIADLLSVLRIIDTVRTTTTVAPTTELMTRISGEVHYGRRESTLRWLTSWIPSTGTERRDGGDGESRSILSGPIEWCPLPCRRWRATKRKE